MPAVTLTLDMPAAFAALFTEDAHFVNHCGHFVCGQDTGKKH